MKNNKKANSILIAILMIGFLLVLVVWMFNLMLRDMKDNRWAGNYLKSYAGAEWAMELWLLKIKEKGYWIDEDLSATNSWILSFNPLKNNEPKINYEMFIATKFSSWSLKPWETVIIPLFSNSNSIKEPNFSDDSSWDIIWNIIWDKIWLSWSGSFSYSQTFTYKKSIPAINPWDSPSVEYIDSLLSDFLNNNTWSYLMLFNKNSSNNADYELTANSNFSKPVWTIISSATVGRFRQNITTKIDNTEFLNMLKYSLFSK